MCGRSCREESFFGVEFDDVIFENFSDIKSADCNLLDVERIFEVEVDRVVDVICAEPQTFVTGFGDVDKLDFEFGLGEVVDIHHERHVKSEVCGRITLRRRGHFNHDTREVAYDRTQNSAEIERAFGDAEFEFDGETDGDDGVVEHVGGHVLIRRFFVIGECVGVFDFSVCAVAVVNKARVFFTVAYVCRQQFVACSESDIDAAEFKSHVDATDCYVETEIVFVDCRIEVDGAIVLAVYVFDVTELASLHFFDRTFVAVVADVSVAFDIRIGDDFVAACVLSVHSVTTQADRCFARGNLRIVVCVGVHVLAFRFVGDVVIFAKRKHRKGLAFSEVAVLESLLVAVGRTIFTCDNFVNVGGACLIVFAVCDVVDVVCDTVEFFVLVVGVSVVLILVVELRFFCCVRQVVDQLVDGFAEVDTERNVEHVKHVFERAEVGHERCKHECDQRSCDLDLELSVAVSQKENRVAFRRALYIVACGLCAVLFFVVFLAELICNFLCKVNKVFDLGIVFRSGYDFGEVEIERTAAQIQTAKHLVVAVFRASCRVVFCKVTVWVDFDKFDCEFYLAQIAVCDKAVDCASRGESLQIKSRKVDVCRHFEADTRVECGHRLQVDYHIAEYAGEQSARIDDFRTCGIEVNQTAHTQRNVLILIGFLTASCIKFYFACKSVARCGVAVRVGFRDCDIVVDSGVILGAYGSVRIVTVDVEISCGVVNVFAVGIEVVSDGICVLLAVLACFYGCE